MGVRSGGSSRPIRAALTGVAVLLGVAPSIASPLAAAAKVSTLLTAPSVPLASSAQTTTQISLGLTSFGRILVDPASSHVFVSSPGSNAIAATDLSGNNLKTLPVAGGPTGMAVFNGTLFVALSTGGAIEKIDPVTLTDKGALASGLTQPQELVVAGSKLWTTTGGCGQFTTVLVSVDPSTGTLTTYPSALNTTTNLLALCAGFASNTAASPNQLVAWTEGGFPSLVTTFDVSSGSPVQQQIQNAGARIGIFDLAVTPDGAHYLATAGSSLAEFNLANLVEDGVFYSGSTDITVAPSAPAEVGINPLD